MNSRGEIHPLPNSAQELEERYLIRMLMLSHDPDGRYVDSEQLFRAVKHVIRCAATSDLQVVIGLGLSAL